MVVESIRADWFDVGEEERQMLWRILEESSGGGKKVFIVEGVGCGDGRDSAPRKEVATRRWWEERSTCLI